MKIIAVIPARFASSRFPGKSIALLKGKPIIQWVIEGAQKSNLVQKIYVATDDMRIADICRNMKIEVLMTRADCPTGTDRIFEATKNLDFDVVLNIQGDEPLIDQSYIDPLAQAFLDNQKLDMATLAHPLAPEDLENKNAVKVITNLYSEAIYFSRFAIPYSRDQGGDSSASLVSDSSASLVSDSSASLVSDSSASLVSDSSASLVSDSSASLKHIGLYGYTKGFLQKFCTSEQALIEKYESLEQLRALYLGAKIKVLQVQKPTYGVDTPEDLQKLEALLK